MRAAVCRVHRARDAETHEVATSSHFLARHSYSSAQMRSSAIGNRELRRTENVSPSREFIASRVASSRRLRSAPILVRITLRRPSRASSCITIGLTIGEVSPRECTRSDVVRSPQRPVAATPACARVAHRSVGESPRSLRPFSPGHTTTQEFLTPYVDERRDCGRRDVLSTLNPCRASGRQV